MPPVGASSVPPPPPPPPADGAPVATGGGKGRRGGRVAIIGGVVAALVVAGGIGAYAVYDRLSGGGPQPHDVMPASTQVYLRFDLDPSASQKVDLFKLLRKVPDLADEIGIKDEQADIRELVFPKILASECKDVDYDKDVEPWLGDRIGVGASIKDRSALIAVQVTDEDASRAGIKKLFGCADEKYGIGYRDGYALIAPTQAEVDKAAAATDKATLGDNKTFAADVDSLGDQGIASAWADLKSLSDLPEAKEALGPQLDELVKAGSVATTLRADGDAIELAVLGGIAPTKGDSKVAALGKLPSDTIAALSVSGAGKQVAEGFESFVSEFDRQFAGGGGLGDTASSTPSSTLVDPISTVPTEPTPTFPVPSSSGPTVDPDDPFGSDDPFGGDDPFGSDPTDPNGGGLGGGDLGGGGLGGGFNVQQFLDRLELETGFKLPEDLETLFGDNLTLAIGSKNLEKLPTFSGPEAFSSIDVALSLTSEKAPALDLVKRIAAQASRAGIPLIASPTDQGAVLASNQDAADAISDPKGSLGDEKAFKSVIPDGENASAGLYVNIGTIIDKLLEADPPADVRKGIEAASKLSAVGISSGTQDDRAMTRMRVSFR
ncbi:hypothetical protein DX116_06645 [Aeromicrobium endophyticum]|uniref:DUF3352 domain-containing protein n=2 Tax=Aeromicrobium endophyticum TaxID=2292704 RepID=A0A371PCH3_9ACTN|nr:hypothetical protein DX116_06645 [Aeromicrobium endophyticum]